MTWRMMLMVLLFVSACGRYGDAGATSMPHPDDGAAQVEYFVRKPQGQGPWPTVILLHGAQPFWSMQPGGGGHAFVSYGVLDELANKGYLAVAVSLPGYGNSSGPDDFAGPYTQHAVSGVVAKLKADGLAKPDKVLVEGISLGAVTAALLATQDQSVAGLVLISGLYDMPQFFDQPKSLQATLLKYRLQYLFGFDREALRARSALDVAQNIRAPALIMNGAQDDRTDPQQARLLAERITAQGGRASLHVYPDYGHEIPFNIRKPDVDAFIDSILMSAN